jgi:hypothetical protein
MAVVARTSCTATECHQLGRDPDESSIECVYCLGLPKDIEKVKKDGIITQYKFTDQSMTNEFCVGTHRCVYIHKECLDKLAQSKTCPSCRAENWRT